MSWYGIDIKFKFHSDKNFKIVEFWKQKKEAKIDFLKVGFGYTSKRQSIYIKLELDFDFPKKEVAGDVCRMGYSFSLYI